MSVRDRTRVPVPVRRFVGVVGRPQTYRNLVYLALTFPLGIAYFVFLTTALSLGFGLLTILVGLPILIALVLLSDRILVFERWLAATLLGEAVPTDREDDPDEVWDYVRAPLVDLGTWVGILFLASKFFVGIATFLLLVLFGAFSGAMLLAPLYYQSTAIAVQIPQPIHLTLRYAVHELGGVEVVSLPVTITSWEAATLPDALALSVIGALTLVVSLHVCNGLARIQGWYARLLTKPRPMR